MKTVTNNMVKKMIKQSTPNNVIVTVSIADKTIAIEVTPVISIANYITMVNEVVNSVIIEEDYRPYLREYAINCNILRYFTNIDTSDIELIYNFVYTNKSVMGDIVDIVVQNYPHIIEDIDEMIDYKKEYGLKHSKWDSVADNIIDLTSGLSKLSNVFGNANSDDIKKALTQIGNITKEDIKDMYVKNGNN